jgi:chromosomal replication initiation ATPase DnaA
VIPFTMGQRAVFIPHDGFARMPEFTRVSATPTQQIQELVAVAYGLHPEQMKSECRERYVAWPRQIAMYLTREITGRSYPCIAKSFNKKDHTTIIHAVRLVERKMVDSPELRDEVASFFAALPDRKRAA